ncbi:glutamate-5-semialdehyde dehydrogenase [Rhizomicrobium electricum]|jgi:glutamate-5-semialdehyde dehydrogenase|uniref:Gamma-glutamyl phosphate reductase n=1 Tax=Rhizomicrobium electricum TaxID=480070 RepID=A0ABP3PWB0_9PROT|nr:glutamate-5-semialdehyde dehydrogenase [Rhizomicrobium electricum]NIJ49919.1 glutamate-5-semialdehyde dehydrogenase [Rhizomicrobium electricum]
MSDDLSLQMNALGAAARVAARAIREASTEAKNAALLAAAAALRTRKGEILAANDEDMAAARERGLSNAMLDRLMLDGKRVEAMAQGVEAIAALADPVGRELARWTRPNGLDIARVATPIGVIGIIYESRPNVTADAAALCLKSGNAVILRGGSESARSSAAILAALREGLADAGLPAEIVQLVPTTDRAAVGLLLQGLNGSVDLIIPRGGKSLVARVQNEARVPVLAHLEGICHTYIDAAADPDKARAVTVNAKMRRTGICGATETLLIDRGVAKELVVQILDDLAAKGCEIRADDAVWALYPAAKPASEEDWRTEYLDAIISVKLVDGVEEAIAHIEKYGSHHTEAIITEDRLAAERFLDGIDSAIVLWNASTQFADGGEFGMGAEIGIGTGKLHARGPVGVEQLCTFKYVVRGNGQTRP